MVSASNTLMPVDMPSATLLVMMVTMTVRRLGSLENAEAMRMPNMTNVESNIVFTKKRRMLGYYHQRKDFFKKRDANKKED